MQEKNVFTARLFFCFLDLPLLPSFFLLFHLLVPGSGTNAAYDLTHHFSPMHWMQKAVLERGFTRFRSRG